MSPSNISMNFVTDKKGVEVLFKSMNYSLSPVGLAAFMSQVVDPYLHHRAHDRFVSEGDDATGRWLPLKPSTVVMRTEQGFPGAHPINRRTGELERFITERPGRIGQEGAFTTLTLPDHVPSGELGKKFVAAQTGKVPGRKAHSARPVLKLNERDMISVVTELSFFIMRGGQR